MASVYGSYPPGSAIPGLLPQNLGPMQISNDTYRIEILEQKLEALMQKLNEKTSIEVSVNQEERIVELEAMVTELKDDLDRRKVELEKAHEEKLKALANAKMDAEALANYKQLAPTPNWIGAIGSSSGAYANAYSGSPTTEEELKRLTNEMNLLQKQSAYVDPYEKILKQLGLKKN